MGGVDVGKKEYFADWMQSHALDSVGAEFDPLNPYYGNPVNGFPVWDRTLSLEARAIAGGGTQNQRYTGVYAQDELGFYNNTIRLTVGGRYTTVTQSAFGGADQKAERFTPRVGLSVSIDKNTSVYALYDQAFIPQSGILRNGGKIKPITGENLEFGIKRDWFNGKWNTTASVYRIVKNNELTADPTNSGPNESYSVVLGQKRAEGIEFDVRGNVVRGLSLIANYAYTNSKVTKVTKGVTGINVGDVIPGFAKHTANAWLSYKVMDGALKGVGISAGFNWQIDRATSNWNDNDTRYNLPDYFKLDGGVFWEKNKVRLSLNMFNVLNKYLYSGGYYEWLNSYYWQTETPRNLRFSMSYKF
jgi:iron complex outermembrane receptor protein